VHTIPRQALFQGRANMDTTSCSCTNPSFVQKLAMTWSFLPDVDVLPESARRLTLFRPRVHELYIDFDLSFIGSQCGSDAVLHVSSTWAKRLAAWNSKIQQLRKSW